MRTLQGAGALTAGLVAEQTSPAIGMTTMAAASIAVTLALAPRLHPHRAQATRGSTDAKIE
jgi:hypothetical protein